MLAARTAKKGYPVSVVKSIAVGTAPWGAWPTPDGSKVYVPNNSTNNVSVINTSTDTVIATVTVGTGPSSVWPTADGSKVYVLNGASTTVSVISTSSDTVIATITVGSQPVSVGFTADGSKAYIANFGGNTVSVVNTSSNTVSSTITTASGPRLVISPDTSRVYVTNYGPGGGTNSVSVINTSTDTVIATVAVGFSPTLAAVTPDGSKVYVPNYGSNTVSVINATNNTILATVTVGNNPRVAGSPDGTKIFALNWTPGTVSVISTSSNTVVATITVGANPYISNCSFDASRLYVPNNSSTSTSVSVIDTVMNTVAATVTVGSVPYRGNFLPDGSKYYMANSTSNDVAVLSSLPKVNLKGTTQSSTTSITLPSHNVGDLIIIWAGGSASAPTAPSASGTVPTWQQIHAATGATKSITVSYAVATATNHTSGTWTNATSMFAAVLSGQNVTSPIGGNTCQVLAATTTPAAPSVTLNRTDATSQILHVFMTTTTAPTWSTTPTGYWVEQDNVTTVYGRLLSKLATLSDGAVTYTTKSQVFVVSTVEICI